MGLLSSLIGLPVLPARAAIWIAEQVAEEADRQLHDPALIMRELDQVDQMRRSGQIDPAEADALEEDLVARLMDDRTTIARKPSP